MNIEPIHNNGYERQREFRKSARLHTPASKQEQRKTIDAVMFDSVPQRRKTDSTKREIATLTNYINALSDDEAKRRINKYINSYNEIEECLIHKLIMEAL